MSESAKSEDYRVAEVASVVVVLDGDKPVGLDLVMHESVGTSEEAVRVLQRLGAQTGDISWNLNVLKRHAMMLGGDAERSEVSRSGDERSEQSGEGESDGGDATAAASGEAEK